jgi:hypothetical protein
MGFEPGLEADASAVTASGAAPLPGLTARFAAGAATTVTAALALELRPPVSVTVRVTV